MTSSFVNPDATTEDCQLALEQLRHDYKRSGGRDTWQGFMSLDYPHESSAAPPTCPEHCWHCSEQFVPLQCRLFADSVPVEFHDDNTAAHIIHDLVTDTEQNLLYVRTKIDEYGSAIAKRWRKWNPLRREATLRNTALKLYENKYDDIEICFELDQEVSNVQVVRNRHGTAESLWPPKIPSRKLSRSSAGQW